VTASSAPPAARQSGTMSSSGRVATMTPAACTPWLRAWSSRPRAWSKTRAIFGSAEIICAIFGSFAIASSIVMSSSAGIRFARFWPSAGVKPITRATSFTAAFAFRRPKVMICATWPYFLRTWSITDARPSWQMSMSMSGYSERSGSVKRSKRSPYFSGHAFERPST
jgi:hypothetical protein